MCVSINSPKYHLSFPLVHEDHSLERWWKGCNLDLDSKMGCSQHPWTHQGEEYLVDECDCDTPLCNQEMGPMPETTTKSKIFTGQLNNINTRLIILIRKL